MKYLSMSIECSRDRGFFAYGPGLQYWLLICDCNIDYSSVTAIRGTMFDRSVQFPPVFVSTENDVTFYKFIYRNIQIEINVLKILNTLTFWRRISFFQILAHPVFKMWVIQKPNKVALWNKRHFEEKKWKLYSIFKIFSTDICWINIKWGI